MVIAQCKFGRSNDVFRQIHRKLCNKGCKFENALNKKKSNKLSPISKIMKSLCETDTHKII